MTNYEIVLKARLDEAQKRIAELEARDKKAVELLDEAIQVTFSQKAYCMIENDYSGESQCAELIDGMRAFIPEGGADG